MAQAPFQVKVSASATTLRLDKLPSRFRERLLTTVQSLDQELLGAAKDMASSLLEVHSGKYVESFKGAVRDSEKRIAGVVYSDAPQAEIFEWGGTIPFHEILPNVAGALAFMIGGQQIFAAGVAMPDVTIKKYAPLHSALYSMHQKIVTDMGDAVNRAAQEP